ncbi:DoxX family protein, partial [Corynebacterium bovis]|uniref:DoxX family protein n=1 Tax=Corynebacterium bovis TaxID=36808 RepID=UPI0031399D33
MTVLRDIVLLISRILLGVILAAHGIQKWTDIGVGAVADQFATLGVPAPDISAPVVATAEILGGVAVILGVLTRLAGVLVVVLLAGAVWFAHRHAGIFVTDGGWELPVAIAAGFLLLAATGAGRVSVDALVTRRRTAAATTPATTAAATTTSPATTPAAATAGTTIFCITPDHMTPLNPSAPMAAPM